MQRILPSWFYGMKLHLENSCLFALVQEMLVTTIKRSILFEKLSGQAYGDASRYKQLSEKAVIGRNWQ
jgi:hypothetical protein